MRAGSGLSRLTGAVAPRPGATRAHSPRVGESGAQAASGRAAVRARERSGGSAGWTARTGGVGAAGGPAAPAAAGSAGGSCCPGAFAINQASARWSKVAFEPRPKSQWSRCRAVSGKAAYVTLPGHFIQCRHAQASRAESKSGASIAWAGRVASISAKYVLASETAKVRTP